MRVIIAVFIGLSLLSSANAFAKEEGRQPCSASKWPFSRKQSGEDFQKTFLISSRAQLESYLLAELTEKNLAASPLTYDLARFLIDTEQDKMKKSYYELLRWGADLHGRGDKPKLMRLKEVCEIKSKILKGA